MAREDLHFRLRIPEDLKARVEAAARGNHRSMTAEIVATLEEKYPAPMEDMELSTLASWIEYVRAGGPSSELDDRLSQVNAKLAKHSATKHLLLGILVTGDGDDMKSEVILKGDLPIEMKKTIPTGTRIGQGGRIEFDDGTLSPADDD
ncbi:Arc family DNA-binding protein [Mameliella alba]|uniref:Arc family DNA-binding protein n=1 Tax=Mameliella alba TaxID=561184 RepID=UPI0009E4C220|nr:Arc family DNA-binding protein [Mameliella alba]